MTSRHRAAVLTQTNTYRRNRGSGEITGEIALWIDDAPFPGARWMDAPVAVLGAWLSATGRIQRGEAAACTCYFTAGPFAFRLRAADDGMWQLECLSDHRVVGDAVLIPAGAFMASLAAAAEAALVFGASQAWSTQELAILEATLRRNRRE